MSDVHDKASLIDKLIESYSPLLFDANLVFAILLAWALTGFIKQAPFILSTKPAANRRWRVRLISAIIGFLCVVFMKREMIYSNPDHVITFGILVAFTHGFIYNLVYAAVNRISPTTAEIMKGKK